MTTRPFLRRTGLLAALALASCAWSRPATPRPAPGVRAVAVARDVVYALSYDGHQRAWSGDRQPPRPVDLERVVALAGDGSLAATVTHDRSHGHRVEVWALPSRTLVQARAFADGVHAVLGLSRAGVALSLHVPPDPEVHEVEARARGAWRGAVWAFDGDVDSDGCVDLVDISPDGRHLACGDAFILEWSDLREKRSSWVAIATDWEPPPQPPSPSDEVIMPGKPVFEFPDFDILSVRLGAGGKAVFVTYCGTDAHRGWRLERWAPIPPYGGELVRLASTDHDARARLLAISPDGQLAVLVGEGEPLTLRRAPAWTAAALPAPPATAAAFSPDGTRLVTGHADGSLRLWDAGTGRMLAP
jgi:hypothetical protein